MSQQWTDSIRGLVLRGDLEQARQQAVELFTAGVRSGMGWTPDLDWLTSTEVIYSSPWGDIAVYAGADGSEVALGPLGVDQEAELIAVRITDGTSTPLTRG